MDNVKFTLLLSLCCECEKIEIDICMVYTWYNNCTRLVSLNVVIMMKSGIH